MPAPYTPRPLPVETVDVLRPPQTGFPYFSHADTLRFQPRAVGHSAVNAWWLADASFLVYGGEAFIVDALAQSSLPSQGYELQWLGTPEDNRGMVLANDDAMIVVFRGTRLAKHTLLDAAEVVLINQYDFWTDSQFFPAVHRIGGRVHAGFSKAYAEVSEQLDAIVQARRPGQAIWLAGHSLGGALATLAAAHLAPGTIQGLYTYGCPRVGNGPFAKTLPVETHCRFVHRDDWVPLVPPALLGYQHAGVLCAVPGTAVRSLWSDFTSGAAAFKTAVIAMTKELRMNVGELPFKVAGLADHAPVYYATLLWNALLAENTENATSEPPLDG